MNCEQKLRLQLVVSLFILIYSTCVQGQSYSHDSSQRQFISLLEPYLNSATVVNERAKGNPNFERWANTITLAQITPTWLNQASWSKKIATSWIRYYQSPMPGAKNSLDLLGDYVFYQEKLCPVLGFMNRDSLALLMVYVESDTAVFLLKKIYDEYEGQSNMLNTHRLFKDRKQEPVLDLLIAHQELSDHEFPVSMLGTYFSRTTSNKHFSAASLSLASVSVQSQAWKIVQKGTIAVKNRSAYRFFVKNKKNGKAGYVIVQIVDNPTPFWKMSFFEPGANGFTTTGLKKMKDSYKIQRLARKVLSILMIIISCGSILTLMIYYVVQRRRKYQQSKAQIALSSLRAQLNPHFLFNTLTSIQDLMNQDNKPAANRYFNEMAQLLRYVVDSSAEEYTSLASELAALEKYCSLEALRTPFSYEFDLHPDLDLHNLEIPTMLLQPFVENAILHGLRPSQGSKHLKISLWPESGERLGISIIDDGIGIEESKSRQLSVQTKRSHQGINTTEKRIDLINQGKKHKIMLKIEDRSQLKPNQTGTQVQLSIPV